MTENKKFRIINEYGDYHLLNGNKKLGYDLCSPSMMKENWNNVVDELNKQDARIKSMESQIKIWEKTFRYGDIIDLKLANEVIDGQREELKRLGTELKNMTQRFEYELQMKLKYHSELIDCKEGMNDS